MGPLLSILLALGALALREYEVDSGWRAAWAAPLLVLVPYFLAAQARGAALRGKFRAADRWQRAITLAPAACFALALCVFGWTSELESWFGRRLSFFDWPRLEVLAVLVPFAVYEIAALDARVRLLAHTSPARARLRSFQLRLLAAALVPLLLYVLISAAVGARESWRVRIDEVGLWHALYAGALLVLLVLALPLLLARTLDTQRVPDGPLRELFDAVAARARFRAREIYVWNTGGNMANAAIIGLGARSRIVLFSDLLLTQLDARELAAVFAHEIAHAKRHHVPLFGCWVLAFFLGGDLLSRTLFAQEEWLAAGALLVVLGGWFAFFGWLSRRCELEADLFAIQLLGDPGAIISALERVGGQLRDVASWRHFSTARRVEFLARAAGDPAFTRRFLRRLRLWTRAGVLLFALALVFEGRRLAHEFEPDQLRADLRLGQYASAAERAPRIEGLDPALARLVERARSLQGAEAGAAELEAAARAALARDELAEALEYLQLGALRGREDLAEIALALASPRAHALDPALAQSWAAELARAGRLAPQPPDADGGERR